MQEFLTNLKVTYSISILHDDLGNSCSATNDGWNWFFWWVGDQPSTYDVSYLAFFVVFEVHCVLERIGISRKGYVH